MKASDLNTIKRLIAEYGMKSGASTPVGQQKSGETAKANKTTKSVMSKSQSSMMNKPPKSPTLQATPQTQVGKDQEKVEPTVSAVKDLDTGAMFKNEKGDELEVVDTVGNQSNPDAIVAKDKKGEFVTIDPKDEVEIAGEVTEGNDIDRLLKRKSKLKRKIKKVLRAQKHKTQGEPVFEINFNNKAVAQSGLNAPIQCGFEAETTWPDVTGGDDDDGDWLEGKTWGEVSDLVYDQEGSRSVDRIEQNYREWLMETDYFHEAESDVIRELVVDRKEDEYYIDDYVSSRVSETDIEDYRDDKLADLESAKDEGDEDAATEYEEREDWDTDAWGREYVEENEQGDFEEWLEEQIQDNGEHWDDAWERAMEACDIDQYMYDEHGSWYDLLRQEDIFLYNEEAGGGLDEVASMLEDWASNNSKSNDVRPGDYHSGQGVDNTYWRVESDSSIEGDGTGAEIISPVFDSPAEMLKEMKSLFEFLQSEGVETNQSTGLHVTMSMSGDAGKTNPLKMALLLGDKYLLKQFDREFNSYAKSQQDSIKKQLDRLALKPADVTSEELEQVEALLQRGIDFGKFSSINFKDAENSDGNKLVEFRIGGGDDYHEKFDTVAKSTIRYAVTLLAGHDETAFRQDYLKAMMRMINKQTDVSKDVQQKATQLVDPESMNDKVLSAFQAIASEKHYSDALEALSNAYMQLADVNKMRSADPQKELDFGEAEEIDADDWRRQMKVAQKYFVRAFAMLASDVASGANRAPAKAAQVAALRGAVKEFGLTADILWSELQQSEFVKRFPGDHHSKLEKMASAVNSLLKKQDAKAPEAAYTISVPQGHVIAIPTEKHHALFGDIFDRGKKDDNATISQQDFKVINDDEIDKVKRARYEMEYNERFIEREKEMIDGIKQSLKVADPEKAKDLTDAIRQRQEKVAEWEAENSEYRIDVDIFVKKHGFAPASIRSGSEPIGTPYSFVHDDQRKELSQRFNIKFDVQESKMTAFDKFGKLPLEEQLRLLEKVDKQKIDEAWSKKYKDSINCSNPKGFSQKAHCAGKKKKVNEEWRDVYRDYKGMGYSDAEAKAEANKRYPDEAPQRSARVQQKPELAYYMFYDVPKDREQEALDMGVKKLKSGKFAIPVYNTSGRSTQIRITNANTAFGAGKQWAPKKTNETIEAEQDMAALLTAYGTPKKKKKTEDATGKQEDEFHKKLDKLVHKTFGHSSDEKKKKKKNVKEGAVPERNIKRAVHEIMSKPLLGSDLQGQMNAYFAVPDPAMVRDFRSMIASGGRGVDLRPVFEMYAKAKLHPTSKKQAGIKESKLKEYDSIDTAKQEIIKTVSGLSADNKEEAQLLDRIYKLLNSERIGTTIGTAFQKPLTGEPMTDKEKQQIMQDMTAIIGGLDSDYATLNNFLQSLEQQGGVVNLKELAKPLNSFQNVFGSDIAINALVKLANYGVGKKQKGPGEYALAILSDKIHLATGEGDLEVDGIGKVELKAAVGSAGGRIGYGGGSQKAKRAVIDKYAEYIPTVVNSIGGTGGSLGLTKFIQALNTDLPVKDQENQKVRQAIASDLLTMDMEQFAGPVIDTIAKTEDIIAIEDAYLRQNFEWYKDRDDFDALLLMHMPNKKTSMIRNADDLIAFRRSGHSNATSISIIPTQAGAGREQWAQLTLNKGKV